MKQLIQACCILLIALSCNPNRANRDVSVNQSADDSLLVLARNNFKVLPIIAVSNTNKVTQEKVMLGQLLYCDTRLSKSGRNSCNGCHNLSGYGVDNMTTSLGDAGKFGTRNSPTVFNAALHKIQFWDGRAKDIEEQAGMPILNPVEMAIPHEDFLIDRLRKLSVYRDMFQEAFAGEPNPVNYKNVQQAIGAFERTLLTPSRFDLYLQGDKNAITPQEKVGLSTFIKSGCITCHNGVGIGGDMMQRFGLNADYRKLIKGGVKDDGRKGVTHSDADEGLFKVPGLRNVAFTYPYFHDGSVKSLDSAVAIMGKAQMNKSLTDKEIKEIVVFLNSLSGKVRPESKIIPVNLLRRAD